MKFFSKLCLLSTIFCTVTLGVLLGWPQVTGAAPPNQAQAPVPAASAPAPQLQQRFPASSAGDVVDVARLVLETTREQTASVTGLIERATTVIVVFFTLIGAVAAAFGWHKFNDMKTAADAMLETYRTGLTEAQQKVLQHHDEFKDSLHRATAAMRIEMNGQIELMAARVELDQALNKNLDAPSSNRMLMNAVKRINFVLHGQDLSPKAKLRGLADLAYAKKRLGDIEAAFEAAEQAAKLAKEEEPATLHLIAYNAACYACLLDKPEAIEWLKTAIEGNSQHKESAARDPDFHRLKESAAFQNLLC